MIKIENVVLPSEDQWNSIIMGARNPLNSWSRSDSGTCMGTLPCHSCTKNRQTECNATIKHGSFIIGPKDKDLMMKLRNSGTDHRKFMRMITVYLDITAPLYWWKEFSTYKVGTVANSCSTMHKIHAKEFTLEDFSCEHLLDYGDSELVWGEDVPLKSLEGIIRTLNVYREKYLETKDKQYWWQMIQLLPSSYNQKRTVMLNYEVLANMFAARCNHKLDEWRQFCQYLREEMPYSELITGEKEE